MLPMEVPLQKSFIIELTKPFMGLTSFKGELPSINDIEIAKNYLTEEELNKLNDLTNMFLVFAEDEAKERHIMTMQD